MTKIDESKLSPVGENLAEALEGANTPMAALAAAYNHAPSPVIRNELNRIALRVLNVDMRMLQELLMLGPYCDREVIDGTKDTVRSIFSDAMDKVADETPEHAPTATVRQIGEDVADLIDSGIKRVLFDDDTLVMRQAVSNIIEGHAQIMAGLADLALTEERKKEVEEAKNAAH